MQSYTHVRLKKYIDCEYHKFILSSRISLISGMIVQFKDCTDEDGSYLTDHVGIRCNDSSMAYWLFYKLPQCDRYEVECKVHEYKKGNMDGYTFCSYTDFGLTDLKTVKARYADGCVLYNFYKNSIEQIFYTDDENHVLYGSKVYHMYLDNGWKQFHDEEEYNDVLRGLEYNNCLRVLNSFCREMCSYAHNRIKYSYVTQEYLNKLCPDGDKSILDCLLKIISKQLIYFKDKEELLMDKYRKIESCFNMLPVK